MALQIPKLEKYTKPEEKLSVAKFVDQLLVTDFRHNEEMNKVTKTVSEVLVKDLKMIYKNIINLKQDKNLEVEGVLSSGVNLDGKSLEDLWNIFYAINQQIRLVALENLDKYMDAINDKSSATLQKLKKMYNDEDLKLLIQEEFKSRKKGIQELILGYQQIGVITELDVQLKDIDKKLVQAQVKRYRSQISEDKKNPKPILKKLENLKIEIQKKESEISVYKTMNNGSVMLFEKTKMDSNGKLEELKKELENMELKYAELTKEYTDSMSQISPEEAVELDKEIRSLKKEYEDIETNKEELLLGNRELASAYELETLKLYKKQYDKTGFILFPSRVKYIREMREKLIAGDNVILVGGTGTGKTELAIQAIQMIQAELQEMGIKMPEVERLDGKNLSDEINQISEEERSSVVEVLSGSPAVKESDFIAKLGLKGDGKGGTETFVQLGKLIKAWSQGKIPIIDELNLIESKVLMRIKHLLNMKPGSMYYLQENGIHGIKLVTTNFVATANIGPKYDRENIDQAMQRNIDGIDVSYLSKAEMEQFTKVILMDKDVCIHRVDSSLFEHYNLAANTDEKGVQVNQSFIVHIIEAVKTIEALFEGKKTGLESVDDQTKSLQDAVLDIGRYSKLFRTFNQQHLDFVSHVKNKIIETVCNPVYPLPDIYTLIGVFSQKGILTKDDLSKIRSKNSNLDEEELKKVLVEAKVSYTNNFSAFCDPSQLVYMDSYAVNRIQDRPSGNFIVHSRVKLQEFFEALRIDKGEDKIPDSLNDILDRLLDTQKDDFDISAKNQETGKTNFDELISILDQEDMKMEKWQIYYLLKQPIDDLLPDFTGFDVYYKEWLENFWKGLLDNKSTTISGQKNKQVYNLKEIEKLKDIEVHDKYAKIGEVLLIRMDKIEEFTMVAFEEKDFNEQEFVEKKGGKYAAYALEKVQLDEIYDKFPSFAGDSKNKKNRLLRVCGLGEDTTHFLAFRQVPEED